MKTIQNKLSSQSGASMLLALVFLLFCLFVGGSVLSAASANGSRAARQKENQQAYLSQRSASLLLADMLRGGNDAAMQLTVKDVNHPENGRSITFTIHGTAGYQKPAVQRIFYDYAINKYIAENVESNEKPGMISKNYYFVGMEASQTNVTATTVASEGNLEFTLSEKNASSTFEPVDEITVNYVLDEDGNIVFDYTIKQDGVIVQPSYVTVSMKCYVAEGRAVTVNGVTTKTTIIRWDDPVIEKGGE